MFHRYINWDITQLALWLAATVMDDMGYMAKDRPSKNNAVLQV
jgi:hypothetical protein